jgi:multiple sugar transport system permease protein
MKSVVKNKIINIFVLIFLSIGGITMLFPFIWMVSTSLKSFEQIFTTIPQLIPNPLHFEKYVKVWSDTLILSGFKNSTIVAVCVLTVGSFTSSLAAFSFARLRLPHGDKLFLVLLSTIMLPFAVVMIPQFVVFSKLGWTDTLLPLIIPGMFGNVGMIFFLRQYMSGIPAALFDSGRVDGCTPFGLYSKIMLPIAMPAIAVQVIIWFMLVWNDFLGPIIYINTPEKMPVQAVIASMNSQYVSENDTAMLMTASVLTIMPVLVIFLIFQKHFVDSLAFSGIKG